MYKGNLLATEETLILVDKEDNIIGYETKDKCHQGEGLLHRAFSIFIFNEKKQLLIQRRSEMKELWPLYWSNSVCSHPRKGETYKTAVKRRLKEELGIETALKHLFKFKYQASFKNTGSEYELCAVYIGKTNVKVMANKREIAEWKYINLEKLSEEFLTHPEIYTPWFKIEWERINKDYLVAIRFDK